MYHQINQKQARSEMASRRLHVSLPPAAFEKLEDWANAEGRPIANLASYLLQKALEEAEEQGKLPGKSK